LSYVDLHCHSTASDGEFAPREVVRKAKAAGLSGLALTDHDTVAGLADAADEAATLGLDFITGIEISCRWEAPGHLHMLGYGVDPTSADLQRLSRDAIEARNVRNPKMIQKLRELGIDITMEEVAAKSGGEVVSRPHMAKVLVEKGVVACEQEAFNRYLGEGAAAYYDKERLDDDYAIGVIRKAGGVAVLAHPVHLRTANDAHLRTVVKNLADKGLEGIEVLHSEHSAERTETYRRIAADLGLLMTGGSDFHGKGKKGVELGLAAGRRIPGEWLDALKQRAASRRSQRRG